MGLLTTLRNLFRRKPKAIVKKHVAKPPTSRTGSFAKQNQHKSPARIHPVLDDEDDFEDDENLMEVVRAAFNSEHGVTGSIDDSGELTMTEICADPDPDLSLNETCYEPERYRKPEQEPEIDQAPEPVRETYREPEPVRESYSAPVRESYSSDSSSDSSSSSSSSSDSSSSD
jgi:hypothetical protein